MTKRHNNKKGIARRLRENLWGDPKSPYNARPYRPGQHGKRVVKLSDYGKQLQAKKKLKSYYGDLTEKQFYKTYVEAQRRKGDSSENLIEILERRLTTVIYRAKFASTPFAARQLVSHGHVKVNGQKVTVGSIQINDGDIVELSAKALQNEQVMTSMQVAHREIPAYLEVDHKKGTAKFTFTPKLADVPFPVQMEPNLVIEFYSK